MNKGIKLDSSVLPNAITGGTILGGGGGGSPVKGAEFAGMATEYCDLRLVDINDIDEDSILLTAALVGAPSAKNKFFYASYLARTVELFKENCDAKIGGIITNENGGEATVNGWLQAALLGLPVVDAPCNGRAHPTGVMGSLNLHNDKDYITYQTCVGGNPETGNYVECVFKGNIDHTSKLVRLASIEAGGLVVVARNPVTAAYAKKNAAVGGISHAIKVGEVYNNGLNTSVDKAVNDVAKFLGGSIITKGIIEDFSTKYQGGFDVGSVSINGYEITFWNEYMTMEKDGERISTFPNLIMTFDANTGEPVTTAMIKKGLEIYVISADKKNLKLSATMHDVGLMEGVEAVIGKEIVKYLNV